MNIVFIAICLLVVDGASIQKREAAQPPCFANDIDSPLTVRQLEDYLKDISSDIDLNSRVETRLQEMEYTYGIDDRIRNASFTDFKIQDAVTDTQILVDNLCSNDTTSLLETMREHYELLNELANYLEQLYPKANDNYSRDSLVSIQRDVFDVMCNIKMALKSNNLDPSSIVPSGNLSDSFIRYREEPINRHIQQNSEYVLLLDGRKLAAYLNDLYIPFNNTFVCM